MPTREDPPYVRLANRLSRTILADIGAAGSSGWSISGLDVKPFPKEDKAARFVRHELRDGKLEPAGKAEFEEVQDTHKAVQAVSHQEAKVQRAALEANAKLVGAREDAAEEDDDWEDPVERRQRINDERIAAQQEDETDDPEEQVSRNRQRPTPKSKKKGKSKSKAKAEADA
jgi:hypothetical protein